MNLSKEHLARAAFCCAFGSAAAVLVSIAASQILLGAAAAALLASGSKPRLPGMWLPLSFFLGGTLVSLAFSGAPAAGLPQVKKLFVFLTLLVVCTTFRELADARRLALVWGGVGALTAGWGLAQFLLKFEQARRAGEPFYRSYIAQRITGPMSHWMTFGGQMMIVLVLLAAYLMFSPHARKRNRWLALAACGLTGAALLLGLTRGVWLGAGGAILYLVWFWKKRLLLLAPVIALAAVLASPATVRTRLESICHPHGQLDSNQHRIVCWRTGWEMIRAHPWLGLGPEIVRRDFMSYVPADIPRPLPEGWYGHLHSIYVHYAAERGLPVLAALLWMFGKILLDFSRALRGLKPEEGERRFLLHGALAVTLAIMISGASELNLGDSEVLAMFLAVIACGYLAVPSPVRENC